MKSPFFIFLSKQEFAYKAWHSICVPQKFLIKFYKLKITGFYIKQIKEMEDCNS